MDLPHNRDITMFFEEPSARKPLVKDLDGIVIVKDDRTDGKLLVFNSYQRLPNGLVKVTSLYDPEELENIMGQMGYKRVSKKFKNYEGVNDFAKDSFYLDVIQDFIEFGTDKPVTEH